MNRTRKARLWGALALLIIPTIAWGGCAVPSEGSRPSPTTTSTSNAPVRAVDLAEGEQSEPVDVSVDGGDAGVSVTFREITIAPGAGTGRHCHYGQLIAVVAEGTLTHYAPTHPGGVRVYREGESIVEGPEYVHEGRNEGSGDVVLWVTYVVPDGLPLTETDVGNCDG